MAVTFTTKGSLNKSSLRQANERLMLNAIRQNPSISRSDLVRITGLSPSSVTFILKRLKKEKVIAEEKVTNHSQLGRRPTVLNLRPEARMAVGVEVARSGARVVLADLSGTIVRDKTIAWHPNHGLYLDRVHSAICSFVEPLPTELVLGIGVGLPGTIERASGKVIAAENLNWFGINAGAMLRRQLSSPFYYENIAKLSALAEMWFTEGNGRPLRDFIFISAHGGLGTGVIINGQVLQGAHSSAAEFGHTAIYADGRRCGCGSTGCWEQYASDLALCRLYSELSGQGAGEGPEIAASAIVRMAREGDPVAWRALEETARNLGIGFANLIWALNPEAIVLGDWYVEAWDMIEETVWSVVRSRVAAYYLGGMRILTSRHAADSSLLGAVALVLTRFFTSFDPGGDNGLSHSVVMHAQSAE